MLALIACMENSPKFNKTTKVIELHVQTYATRAEALKSLEGRRGIAIWSPGDNKCEISFVAGDMETAGHELHHCIYGSFHPEDKNEK